MVRTVNPFNIFDYIRDSDPTEAINPPRAYMTWLNSTTGEIFVCTDATAGSNVWVGTQAPYPPTIYTQFATPVAWFDFSSVNSMYTDAGSTLVSADGQSVYEIHGKYETMPVLSRIDANAMATYKTGIQNGLSVLRFDGTDDGYSGLHPSAIVDASYPVTMITIASNATDLADKRIMTLSDNTGVGGAAQMFTRFVAATSSLSAFCRGASTGENTTANTGDDDTDGTLKLSACRFNATPGLVEITKDDASTWDTADNGTAFSTAIDFDILNVGCFWETSVGISQTLNGDIAELIMYNAHLNDSEIAAICTALREKWGL